MGRVQYNPGTEFAGEQVLVERGVMNAKLGLGNQMIIETLTKESYKYLDILQLMGSLTLPLKIAL